MPAPVSEACKLIADEIEANPDKFIRSKYEPRWIHCRKEIAAFIGAEVDECVLVPNATHGLYTVLSNFDWKEGDVIIKSLALSDIAPEVTDSSDQLILPTPPLKGRPSILRVLTR